MKKEAHLYLLLRSCHRIVQSSETRTVAKRGFRGCQHQRFYSLDPLWQANSEG